MSHYLPCSVFKLLNEKEIYKLCFVLFLVVLCFLQVLHILTKKIQSPGTICFRKTKEKRKN